MTVDDLDPNLQAVFLSDGPDLAGEDFAGQVMSQTDAIRRKKIIMRICIGLILSLLGIPLQDFALATTQVLGVSLFELDSRLLAQVLAPVNSVGSLLSVVLLGLRVIHKRLFA